VTNKIRVLLCILNAWQQFLIWFGAVVCTIVLRNFLVKLLTKSIRMGEDTFRVHTLDLRQTIYRKRKDSIKFRNMINRSKAL